MYFTVYIHINNKDTLDCWVQGALLMIPEAGLGGSPKKTSINIGVIAGIYMGYIHPKWGYSMIFQISLFFFERSVACTPISLVERWMVYANYQDMGGL